VRGVPIGKAVWRDRFTRKLAKAIRPIRNDDSRSFPSIIGLENIAFEKG